ncbi:MAG: putative sensor protein [Frankiales bacterium]|nr:putative sensor protein [Frankiales bacterium]MCW2708098.1 putative sensor protein [Frankiales bacterium]
MDLPAEPASVGQARRFVRGVLADWKLESLVDTVTLLTSELATNAVLHARTGFAVVVSLSGREVRVDVLDGSAVTPRSRQPSLTAATGRGVNMVAALADRWGPTPHTHLQGFAKGVYFTVPIAS